MKKRALTLLLALVFCLGYLGTVALAADNDDSESHWASSIVDSLNAIFGEGVFAAEDSSMTQGEAYSILEVMGCESTKVAAGSSAALTRGLACEALAEVFQLDTGDASAIEYFRDQGLVSGTADGDLDEDGMLTKAQFAVFTFRVYDFAGGVPEPEPGPGEDTPHTVTTESPDNGTVTASPTSASEGTTITVTVTPETGYVLDSVAVTDESGNAVSVSGSGGSYTFTMPASSVTVTVTFTTETEEGVPPFSDVPDDAYFKDAVDWAVEERRDCGRLRLRF